MTIGERIRETRKSRGLTQRELGERLGLSYQSIAQWENDLRKPKFETIQKIADALGVSVSYLSGIENDTSLISYLIKDARERAGMTMEDLAQKSGIPVSLLEDYERGSKKPGIEELTKISHSIGVSVYSLADFDISSKLMNIDIIDKQITYGSEYSQYARMVQAFSYLNHLGAEKAASAVEDLAKIQEYRREDDKF